MDTTMRRRERLSKPRPQEYQHKPKNPEAYKAALQWLQEHDPLDILDEMPGGYEAEEIYREFSTVYCNYTEAKDYPGYYSPFGWGERATFVYGYLLGLEAAKANE